jgi:hypothetical protein
MPLAVLYGVLSKNSHSGPLEDPADYSRGLQVTAVVLQISPKGRYMFRSTRQALHPYEFDLDRYQRLSCRTYGTVVRNVRFLVGEAYFKQRSRVLAMAKPKLSGIRMEDDFLAGHFKLNV